ncbi:MAG: hypothetical protein ACOVOV_10550, partial [Dolichospermum sp.]
PSSYPRAFGTTVQLTRYDNLNGNPGLVSYKVNLKDATNTAIAARPSFSISGITKVSGQTTNVKVYGKCGAEVVDAVLTNAFTRVPSNNTYSITGNVATGTKSADVTSIYGTINVTFPLPVTEVFVEWTVDRTPVRKHYSSLLIGDMSFECKSVVPEVLSDNVYMQASFENTDVLTCNEAKIKLKVTNLNCDTRTVNISNTLPSTLEYVNGTLDVSQDSYAGLEDEAPVYENQNFTLNNLNVPSGVSYVYVKVKPTNVANSGSYSTFFTYTVVGGINDPSPYRSDDTSGTAGYQDITVDYTAVAIPIMPTIVKSVDKCFNPLTGTILTYTLTINSTSPTDLSNVEIFDNLEENQIMVPNSLVITGLTGGTANDYNIENSFLTISGLTIPANTTGATIMFKVNTQDTNVEFNNSASLTIDPSSECGASNSILSNELLVQICPDIDTDIDGISDSIDIDDDNDGVLDTEEMNCEVMKNGTFTQANTPHGAAITNWIATGNVRISSNTLTFNSGDTTPNAVIYQDITTKIGFPLSIKYDVFTSNANMGLRVDILDVSTNTVLASKTTNSTTTVNESISFEPIGTTSRIRITDISTATTSIDIALDTMSILYCDTDNDGTPNSLDLDSDGDGCSDAVEASSSTTATSTSVFPIGTDTNSNGLLNEYEGTTAGTINYTATYAMAINNAIVKQSTIETGKNQSVCVNTALTPITLDTTIASNATVTDLPTGLTSSWSNNVLTISGTPTVSGSFTYTASTTGGCSPASTTGVITVVSVDAGADFTKTCTTNASGKAIGTTAVTGVTYAWTPAIGLSDASVANPTANPTTTTTYTVTATNTASGCTATDEVIVTVDTTVPVADAGADFTKTCTTNASGKA